MKRLERHWRNGTLTLIGLLGWVALGFAGNRGRENVDAGGKGADVAGLNTGGAVRTDATGMGAIQRMMRGTSGEAATVTAPQEMAVRSEAAFGPNIIGTIPTGQPFTVKARDGAWFSIDWPQQPAWVYVTFVEGEGGGQGFATEPGATQDSLQIKQAAYNILQKVPFPYDPATNGGVLGCAQVVSTILKAAGIIKQISLGVLQVMGLLKDVGWRMVSPPPWKDGDVVTWKTYDSSGDGVKDEDTHIGVVVIENGQAYAVNNSSSNRRPEKHLLATYYAPVSHVLRMEGM